MFPCDVMKFQFIPLLQHAWHLRQATRYNFILISITMSSNTETNNLEDVVRELREAMKRISELEARVKAAEDEANARVKAIEDESNARVKAIEDESNARVKAIEDEAKARVNAAEKSETEANHKLQCVMYVRDLLADRQILFRKTGACGKYTHINY